MDRGWIDVVKTEMSYHKTYLRSLVFHGEDKGWKLYSPPFRSLGESLYPPVANPA
jgi:hypothetical protein